MDGCDAHPQSIWKSTQANWTFLVPWFCLETSFCLERKLNGEKLHGGSLAHRQFTVLLEIRTKSLTYPSYRIN